MSKKWLWLLSAWLLLTIAGAYVLWAFQPVGLLKWVLLAIVVPPLYLAVSVVGELLGLAFGRLPGIRQGNAFIERHTIGQSTSGIRILWYFFTALIAIGLLLTAEWIFRIYF